MTSFGEKIDSLAEGIKEHGNYHFYKAKNLISFIFFYLLITKNNILGCTLLVDGNLRLFTNILSVIFAVRIRSVTETMKGKLSLGAKILQVGGVKKVFRRNFSVKEGEKLLKVCQCYLSTSAGPLAGLLFISTDKVAFCSERSIKVSCPTGEFQRVHYRVVIPLGKIKKVNESENLKQPSRKYMRVVTRDDFEFWFMGLLNYERTIISIQNALSHAQ